MKKKIFIIGIVLIVLTSATWIILVQIKNQQMKNVVNRDVIYEGIYVEGISIGGISKSEATSLLESTFDRKFKDKELKIYYEDKVAYKLPYDYFEFKTDYKKLVNKAYSIAREGTLKERYNIIEQMKKSAVHFSTSEWYNDDKVLSFIASIKDSFFVEPKDAVLKKTVDSFGIEDEVIGKAIDIDKSVSAINKALAKGEDEVQLEVITTKPKVTRAYYEDVKELLGSFSTSFSSSQDARNNNLKVACQFINGTILAPNEVFSTNETIGPTDSEHGYQAAPIIIGGILQKGYGGGVCQVSTTLYNAVLYAELEIVERKNHSLAVGYITKGRDATLANGYIDFKFKNNTEYPIYIESYTANNQIYMNIYGKETRDPDRKIDFETEVVNTIMPPPEKVTIDTSLTPDQEVVEKKAIVGYTVKLYKLVYNQNKLQDKIEINTSHYAAYAAQIRRGP